MADINKIILPNGSEYNIKDTTARTAMSGAGASTAGTQGQVPAPSAGDNEKFLRGDGTWAEVSGGSSSVNISFSIATTDWTLSSGVYTASVSDSMFSSATSEIVQYDSSIIYLSSGLTISKDSTTYDIVFTTSKLPTGTISGTIISFGSIGAARGVSF